MKKKNKLKFILIINNFDCLMKKFLNLIIMLFIFFVMWILVELYDFERLWMILGKLLSKINWGVLVFIIFKDVDLMWVLILSWRVWRLLMVYFEFFKCFLDRKLIYIWVVLFVILFLLVWLLFILIIIVNEVFVELYWNVEYFFIRRFMYE